MRNLEGFSKRTYKTVCWCLLRLTSFQEMENRLLSLLRLTLLSLSMIIWEKAATHGSSWNSSKAQLLRTLISKTLTVSLGLKKSAQMRMNARIWETLNLSWLIHKQATCSKTLEKLKSILTYLRSWLAPHWISCLKESFQVSLCLKSKSALGLASAERNLFCNKLTNMLSKIWKET